MKKIAIALAVLFALYVGLLLYNPQPAPDGKRTRAEFAAAVKAFPYESSEERKSQLIQNYPKLSEGMSKEQVAAILGDPDFSAVFLSPSTKKAHGSDWTYCLYCTSQFVGTTPGDKYISVFFDMEGRARWIFARGVEGLAEKGGPWRS